MKNNNTISVKNKDITIVNVNDIEDIILAKSQIDNDDETVKYRSELNGFIDKYCNVDIVLTNSKDINLPFSFSKIFDKYYLFCSYSNDKEKDMLIDYLTNINFDISKLNKLSFVDMVANFDKLEDGTLYIIKDNSYWTI